MAWDAAPAGGDLQRSVDQRSHGKENNTQTTFQDALRSAGRRLLKRRRVLRRGEVEQHQKHKHYQREASARTSTSGEGARHDSAQGIRTRNLVRHSPSRCCKREGNSMGHNNIKIHEDTHSGTQQLHAPDRQIITELHPNVPFLDEIEDEETEDEVDESVAEDMRKLEENFKGISQKYRLINRIGEGTFSTVYKAEQLDVSSAADPENDDLHEESEGSIPASKRRRHGAAATSRIVALKKIYVTSSPGRILNELEILHEPRDCPHICPLLTAFRHHDQVVAVLPYFRHLDFRLYYRDFLTNDLRHYFLSLFSGLHFVHKAGILHRDIKPTNFLYDHSQKHGVLVDFGLAERQGTDSSHCVCQEPREKRRERFLASYAVQHLQNQPDLLSGAYPKQDNRPSRRANRAGTRGFRAPEVLLKCTAQTTKIDMWSVGVILLTLLGRRFPFFNSADDIDAMIEIASIFGKKKMQGVAAMHGSVFETNIETIGERGFTLEKIVLWASCREKENDRLHPGEVQAVDLLGGLLELDPNKRLSAKQALEHEFFTEPVEDEFEKEEREYQEAMEDEARLRQQEKLRRRVAARAQSPIKGA